jgi:hypothetical protein
MENFALGIATGVLALISFVISVWNKFTENKNARISRTITTIEKSLDAISGREHYFLSDDFESNLKERYEIDCIMNKLDDGSATKFVERKMVAFHKSIPKFKEQLITDVLQLYKSIKFFIDENQIDSKMLAIVLQNKIESHLDILKKGIFTQKLLPSDKIKMQDLKAYLSDVSSVLGAVLELKFYTPVKESHIEKYQATVKEYLNP